MNDFVDALEVELHGAARRRAAGRRVRVRRPRALLPAAAAIVALGIGLALVLAVRPAGEEAPPQRQPVTTATTPSAAQNPADVSPGARHGKRFGLGERVATSHGVPVYADIDRWRYCPRDPRTLTSADAAGAEQAVLAIVDRLTTLDTLDARARGTLVTATSYATHQCGALMRNRSVDVGVVLPKVTNSASLSQLDVVVARTKAGWVVFDRRH
jgi:hypothetical protein